MSRNRVPLSSSPLEEAPKLSLPSSVVKAMQIFFGVEITAYLSSARYGTGQVCLQGIVFGDRERRFDDGASIITSIIMSSQELQGFLLVRTLRSVYVVCDWSGHSVCAATKFHH